jgi:hypothetical protein
VSTFPPVREEGEGRERGREDGTPEYNYYIFTYSNVS